MTNDKEFTAICASFPFDLPTLEALHRRLDDLLRRTQNGPPHGEADGTINERTWNQLRSLTWAMRDLKDAMRVVVEDGDPEDLIPF